MTGYTGHCAFYAYIEFVSRTLPLNSQNPLDREVFSVFRDATGHRKFGEPTFGGIIPLMYGVMGALSGLELTMQHSVLPRWYYIGTARGPIERYYVCGGDFGEFVDEITLAPAVYFDLFGQHAFYAEEVPGSGPDKLIVMAAQFRPREEYNETNEQPVRRSENWATAQGSEHIATPGATGSGRIARVWNEVLSFLRA